MSRIEKTIRLFDIYGSYFNLRINNQAKFRSILGGLLSLITMGVFLFCMLTFGQEFYHKRNLKVSIKNGFFEDADIPTMKKNDYESKTIIFMLGDNVLNRFYPAYFDKVSLIFNLIKNANQIF
jgi:hypothetical protein